MRQTRFVSGFQICKEKDFLMHRYLYRCLVLFNCVTCGSQVRESSATLPLLQVRFRAGLKRLQVKKVGQVFMSCSDVEFQRVLSSPRGRHVYGSPRSPEHRRRHAPKSLYQAACFQQQGSCRNPSSRLGVGMNHTRWPFPDMCCHH